MQATSKPAEQPRALALDALRGLAILMMCLSGVVPEGLPNWMYHGYYPRFLPDAGGVWRAVADPYTHRWQWSSFTWVDWVFPMFLFAMGAAFPLALGRKLGKGVPLWRVVLSVLGRGLALIGFAVYVRQITPTFIEYPTSPATWFLGLLGFALLFPVYARLPRGWGRAVTGAVRLVGVASAVGLVVYHNRDDGDTFGFAQNDIIILLLAHMAVAGSLIWLLTRRSVALRLLCLLPAYVAYDKAMYSATDPARDTLLDGAPWIGPYVDWPDRLLDLRWLGDILPWDVPVGLLDLSPLYDFTWYKFLFVVIPGTIVGDLLMRYLRDSREPAAGDPAGWPGRRYPALFVVMSGLIAVSLVGLHGYGRALFSVGPVRLVTPWAVWVGVVPLALVGVVLVRGASGPMQRLVRDVFLWGVLWLVLGLSVEPFGVGITKGPPVTLSYFFVSLSLSVLLLGALTVWIDAARWPGMSLLVLNGQNPMLAYAGIRNLLAPLVMLPLLAPLVGVVPGIDSGSINGWAVGLLGYSPWTLLVWSVVQTLLLAWIVGFFTRLKIVWRS